MTIPYNPVRGEYPNNFPDLNDNNPSEQSKPISKSLSQLAEENQQLRKQLDEAEATIQSMIAASTPLTPLTALEATTTTDFAVKNSTEASTPGDNAIYHGCDGDDFDPYDEIETFRDRRLDQ